jgi:hypothetical protein
MGRVILAATALSFAALSFSGVSSYAQQQKPTLGEANPSVQGDGTMSRAAARAKTSGTLRLPADIQGKQELDRAHADAVRSGRFPKIENRGAEAPMRAPVVIDKFAGQRGGTAATNLSPPDNEGAIGPTSYIQTLNASVRIYDRNSHAVLGSGTLNQLANLSSSVNSFDPQIIWDPTTNRFYYVMDSVVSSTDNKLSFGYSKTASPSNVTSDWCHYVINYNSTFPDYPKLGDSRFFILIGVNDFDSVENFLGSDLLAVGKPPAGTTCPDVSSFSFGIKQDLRDSGSNRVFTPVPSNQIDTNNIGYAVARSLSLPSTMLWFFNVSRNATTGDPVFSNARGVTVASYGLPANATQPTIGQLLDTSDTRPTQAVQAINPDRGTVQSFYTQHTISDGGVFSAVRWYEINPAPATPVVLRSGTIMQTNTFVFNGAIAPDRRVDGATRAFGDSFAIQYNVSSPALGAGIRVASSFNGGALVARNIQNGVGGYLDFTCPNSGNVCRWGDYAAMTPDPKPTTSGRGEIWGTNQYSGIASPSTSGTNWRTMIFAVQP